MLRNASPTPNIKMLYLQHLILLINIAFFFKADLHSVTPAFLRTR